MVSVRGSGILAAAMNSPSTASQVLFLFSALGAVNGIFLAAYLFTRRSHGLSNVFLAALLLAISIRTGKSAVYYFDPGLATGFVQFGLSACLLIGPLSYLYVQVHLAELRKYPPTQRWAWHLLLPLGLIALGLLFSKSQYPEVWQHAFPGLHYYWLAYLLIAGRQLWQARSLLFGTDRTDDIGPRQLILLLGVYLSSALILLAYMSVPFTSYIVGALSFSFSICITVMIFLLIKEEKKTQVTREKYQNRKLAETQAQQILAALNQAMHEQQLYLNPNFSLALLARKTGLSQTLVSQVLNDNLSQNFNHYVNEFRIVCAKRILLTEPRLSMEQVAERSGFNSSSTFFAAFKKMSGQTPASYRNDTALKST